MKSSRLLRDLALSAVEFLFLVLLWAIFVSKVSSHEYAIGIAAALIATTADWVVKAENFAPFRPRTRWLVLLSWEPWYILKGAVIAFRQLARQLTGQQPDSQFRAVPYRFGGKTDVAAARRALFEAYLTISPDTIVVGIDRDRQIALLHQFGTQDVPELGYRLGARR